MTEYLRIATFLPTIIRAAGGVKPIVDITQTAGLV